MPTFSIITPSLNQGRFLPECLASVRAAAQDTPVGQASRLSTNPTPAEGGLNPSRATPLEIEHLVIDAASTDSTLEILKANPSIRWISEPDRGQSHAINKGLAMATGDILTYLCADDLLEPGSLEKVHTAFQQHPDADLVHGDFFFLEGGSGRKRLKRSSPSITAPLLQKHNPLGQPAVWWRRSVTDRFGPFDESLHYCMDHEFWLRIAPHTRWHHIPEPLATCRLHPGAKTSKQLPAAWHETARMLTREKFRLKPWWDYWNMLAWGHHYYRAKRWWFSR